MTAVAEERVLVVPTARFRSLGHFQGFSADVDSYLPALLEGDDLSYRPRGAMEDDPSFKQLIPYVLFRWTDDAGVVHLFQYTRGGGQGEARLRAKRSVGVGGHISTVDAESSDNHHDVYREGMQRELTEEVEIATEYAEQLAGLINDDETPVGMVHLGMVHIFDVESPAVRPREEDIIDAGFRPVSEILADLAGFETWSQIVVKALFGEQGA
ncbi:MAG: phosphoesterase [Planctomycetaceae bacterium]|nr:phosphoesterase [Planctomycetaceae bacterium]